MSPPTELTIRRAREGDLPQMARIHSASFPGAALTFEERIHHFRDDPRLALEDHWVCLRGAEMAGLFALYNFSMQRLGRSLPIGGIGSVAVAPEARKSQIAFQLMARAVEIMDQNGTPLSLLYPFRHSFYRRLGWGIIGTTRLFRLDPGLLPLFPERSDVVPIATADQYEAVMACYRGHSESSNGLLERPEAVWMERVFKNALCYAYRDPDGAALEGYLTYEYRPHPADESLDAADIAVKDFVYMSHKALRGLLGFLAAQRDQARVIYLPEVAGLALEHLPVDPRAPGATHDWVIGAEVATIGAGLMGRIVQLRRALSGSLFGPGEGSVTLKIRDDLNPRNGEPLTVKFSGGTASFQPPAKTGLVMVADISAFSSIYWGALKLDDALALGLAQLEGEGDRAFLAKVFQVPTPACFDRF